MKKMIAVLALASVFLTGSLRAPVQAQSDVAAQQATGRVLVKPRAGLPLPELDRILGAAGARRAAVLDRINVHVVTVAPGREAALVQALSRNPHIRFAEIDRLVEPNDPGLAQQWYVPVIGADTAWTSSNAIGEGVVLAVCDTGVSSTHPDLTGRLVLPGYNTVDKSSNSEPLNGHGTMVAGTIAMIGGNGIGGVGVAYGGMILPVRVSNRSDGSAYISDIAACITYAADRHARGANASYGVCGSSTVFSAANYMRSKGGVVTVSAGNSGRKESHAQSSAITCVSATDHNDVLTSWSSFGDYVDVAAPGASIYTTNKEGGYSFVNGTSFSAPITLAVYGLMMSASPHLLPAELDQILFETARDRGTSGYDMYYGWGRVDAAFAVSRASGIAPGVDTASPSASITKPVDGAFVRALAAVDVSATDNVGVTKVELYTGGDATPAGVDLSAPYQFTVNTVNHPDGPLTLRALAYDAAGNQGSATLSVTVDNTPPSVSIMSPAGGTTVSGTVKVSVSASDSHLSQITLTIDGKRVASSTGATLNYSWKVCQTPKNCGGTATLVAEATDRAGNKNTHTVTVTRSR